MLRNADHESLYGPPHIIFWDLLNSDRDGNGRRPDE
jgi:hypothetical protein